MRKMILSVITLSSFGFLYGMEVEQDIVISEIIRYATVPHIALIKDDIYKRKESSPAAITVAGKTEQRVIEGFYLGEKFVEGDVFQVKHDGLFLLDPVFKKHFNYRFRLAQEEPASIIVDGKIFQLIEDCTWKNIDKEPVPGKLIFTVEPLINGPRLTDSYYYSPFRRKEGIKEPFIEYYYNDDALKKAEKDLALCYINVLEKAYVLFSKDDQNRSIAFPPLSTLLGMPHDIAARIAVKTVIEFIEKSTHKDQYSEIQFVVEKEEDLSFYKQYLDELVAKLLKKHK